MARCRPKSKAQVKCFCVEGFDTGLAFSGLSYPLSNEIIEVIATSTEVEFYHINGDLSSGTVHHLHRLLVMGMGRR